jgi:hypothetical protein
VRDRRNDRRGNARAGSAAGALASGLWLRFADRPVDSFAILGAAAATVVIVVNAVFLQSGQRPAPFVATPTPQTTADAAPKPGPLTPRIIDMSATHGIAAPRLPQTVPVPVPSPRRNDPIADLIGPSPRIVAVQKALSDYGYGQIKPTGMLDDATSEAIGKFERDHKLPVSGRVSERLVSELTAMTGRPIE